MSLLSWLALIGLVAWLLDRVLLYVEARGWINYRRHGLSRGAASYHALELQSIFDPGIRHTQEIRYETRRNEDDSGSPAGPEDGDGTDASGGGLNPPSSPDERNP